MLCILQVVFSLMGDFILGDDFIKFMLCLGYSACLCSVWSCSMFSFSVKSGASMQFSSGRRLTAWLLCTVWMRRLRVMCPVVDVLTLLPDDPMILSADSTLGCSLMAWTRKRPIIGGNTWELYLLGGWTSIRLNDCQVIRIFSDILSSLRWLAEPPQTPLTEIL